MAPTIPRMRPATLPIIAAPKMPRQIINHQTLIVRVKVGFSSCIITLQIAAFTSTSSSRL